MTTRYRLEGDATARDAALERVHVRCEVLGVVEHDDALELWLDDPLPELADLGVTVHTLPVETRTWTGLENDRPIHVADDLLIRPPWVARPAGFDGVELVVPRGMAFGSGEHGSTQAALLALRAVWPRDAVDVCCDVGTGSGVLAAYAQVRGARHLLACDIEPESVDAAHALLPAADVRLGGPEVFGPAAADLVIANLDARQLAAGLDAIQALWRRTAPLVLSGMRPNEVPPLVARVRGREVHRVERLGYVAVAFVAG